MPDPTGGMVGEGDVYYIELVSEDMFCFEDENITFVSGEFGEEMVTKVVTRRRKKVVKKVSQVKISEKVLIFSALHSGMCPWKNPKILCIDDISYGSRTNFNLDQQRGNDLRRSAQHRTIDAVPFFD